MKILYELGMCLLVKSDGDPWIQDNQYQNDIISNNRSPLCSLLSRNCSGLDKKPK